jgi:hypothetical protein
MTNDRAGDLFVQLTIDGDRSGRSIEDRGLACRDETRQAHDERELRRDPALPDHGYGNERESHGNRGHDRNEETCKGPDTRTYLVAAPQHHSRFLQRSIVKPSDQRHETNADKKEA